MRDHHNVHFGIAERSCSRGVPADADTLANSTVTSGSCTALASARAAVLAQLASGELEGFVMLTRPALAPPWGARYHIADMRFVFAHSIAPLPPGFTVRPCRVTQLCKGRPGSVQRHFIIINTLAYQPESPHNRCMLSR